MLLWIDAQLSPALAPWLVETFRVDAVAVRELSLRDAEDSAIFARAREAGAIVLTKDSDFVDLVTRVGPPPQILWLTCGNTSNLFLRQVLADAWPHIVAMLTVGEPLIEISGRGS